MKNSLSIPKSKLKPKDLDKIFQESSIPSSGFFSKTVPQLEEKPENLQEELKNEKPLEDPKKI